MSEYYVQPEPGERGAPGDPGKGLAGGKGGHGGQGGRGGIGGVDGAAGATGRAGADGATGMAGAAGVAGNKGAAGDPGAVGAAGSVRGIGWMLSGFAVIFGLTVLLVGVSTITQQRTVNLFRESVRQACVLQQAQFTALATKDEKLARTEREGPHTAVTGVRIEAYDGEVTALAKLTVNCSRL